MHTPPLYDEPLPIEEATPGNAAVEPAQATTDEVVDPQPSRRSTATSTGQREPRGGRTYDTRRATAGSSSLPPSETVMNTRMNTRDTTQTYDSARHERRADTAGTIPDPAALPPNSGPWLGNILHVSPPQMLYPSPFNYAVPNPQGPVENLPPGFQAYNLPPGVVLQPTLEQMNQSPWSFPGSRHPAPNRPNVVDSAPPPTSGWAPQSQRSPDSRPLGYPTFIPGGASEPPLVPLPDAAYEQHYATRSVPGGAWDYRRSAPAPASQPVHGARGYVPPPPPVPRFVPLDSGGQPGYPSHQQVPYRPVGQPIVHRRKEVFVSKDPFQKWNQPKRKHSQLPVIIPPVIDSGASRPPPILPHGRQSSTIGPRRADTYDTVDLPYGYGWYNPPRMGTSSKKHQQPKFDPYEPYGPPVVPQTPVYMPTPGMAHVDPNETYASPDPGPSGVLGQVAVVPGDTQQNVDIDRESGDQAQSSPRSHYSNLSAQSPAYARSASSISYASPAYSPTSQTSAALPAPSVQSDDAPARAASSASASLHDSVSTIPASSAHSALSPTSPAQGGSNGDRHSVNSKRSDGPYVFGPGVPIGPPVIPSSPMLETVPVFIPPTRPMQIVPPIIPPDNYIPSATPDGQIHLPPPHELYDPEKQEYYWPRPRPAKQGMWQSVTGRWQSLTRRVSRWPLWSRGQKRPISAQTDDEKEDTVGSDEKVGVMAGVLEFTTRRVPTDLYLVLLLFLPSFYFSRVARLFEEAELAMPEIEQMAIRTSLQAQNFLDEQIPDGQDVFPLQWVRLKSTWEHFIDSLLREWKTLNVISALLLSAILTILQIDDAANDYLTRYTALLSFICSLVSLLFGCIYIIRFATMRKTYKAAEWAMEAQESGTSTWFNVFILLALPSIWLTWSILLYVACIMSYIWRTAANVEETPPVLSDLTVLKIRIGISILLGVALVYACFILLTFRRYGSAMDKKWASRIDNWRLRTIYTPAPPPDGASWHQPPYSPYGYPTGSYGSLPGGFNQGRRSSGLGGLDRTRGSPDKNEVRFRDNESYIPRGVPLSPYTGSRSPPRADRFRHYKRKEWDEETGDRYDIYSSEVSREPRVMELGDSRAERDYNFIPPSPRMGPDQSSEKSLPTLPQSSPPGSLHDSSQSKPRSINHEAVLAYLTALPPLSPRPQTPDSADNGLEADHTRPSIHGTDSPHVSRNSPTHESPHIEVLLDSKGESSTIPNLDSEVNDRIVSRPGRLSVIPSAQPTSNERISNGIDIIE